MEGEALVRIFDPSNHATDTTSERGICAWGTDPTACRLTPEFSVARGDGKLAYATCGDHLSASCQWATTTAWYATT